MLKLHTSQVARKGKAASGFYEVQTFGTPVLDEQKIARSFIGYDDAVKDIPLELVILQAKQLANKNDKEIAKAILVGLDVEGRSETAKNTNEANLLGNRILALGLATDKDHAVAMAKGWIPRIKDNVDLKYIPDMETGIVDQLKRQRVIVDRMIAAGEWKGPTNLPRLVDNRPTDSPSEVSTPEVFPPAVL